MTKKQPRFKTETHEAEWWAKNQNLIADRFDQAKATGKLGKGTVARVAASGPAKPERHQRSQSGCRKTTSRGLESSLPRRGCGTRRTSKCCFTKL